MAREKSKDKKPEKPLSRSFFQRPTLEVAHDLVGMVLVDERPVLQNLTPPADIAGRRELRIVEVEAYIGEDDPACHAAVGPTARNQVMYGPAGHAYVYLIYGMYHCLNIVTESEGFPAALLLRAAEPLSGELCIDPRRGSPYRPDGPGKLCLALGVDRSDTGLDLTSGGLYLLDRGLAPATVRRSSRIGISSGIEKKWRFIDPLSPFVSARKSLRKLSKNIQ